MRIGLPFLLLLSVLPLFPQTPAITPGGVLNAADGSRDLAPGSLVSIYGSNLAPVTVVADVIPLPATLQGVSVEVVDGGKTLPAALWFVSAGQINAQLPFGLSGADVQIRVKTRAGTSNAETAAIMPRAPRLFTKTMNGKGEPLLIHANYTLVSDQSPAVPGEAVFVYLNGMGEVTPALAAGQGGGDGAKSPLNKLSPVVTVTVGGRPAEVYYAGMAPGFVVYQVNFQIPPDTPSGSQPVVVSIAQTSSQAGVKAALGHKLPVLASGAIGAEGGTLGSGGTTLKVPAGAFAAPAAISVSKTQEFIPATTQNNTDLMVLSGMPERWSAPLTVSLEMPYRIFESGERFLVMQSKTFPEGTGMQVLDATVNDRTITATIPAVEDTESGIVPSSKAVAKQAIFEPSGPEISFYMMTYYNRIKSPSGKFMIFYSPDWRGLDAKAERTGVILDEAYKKLESLGLSWEKRTRDIRVVLYPFPQDKADRWGEVEPSRLGTNYYSLSLNSTRILNALDETELRATIAHELFHVMQALYDPRGAVRAAVSAGTWLWYHEAASTWFESVFLGNDNYIPGQVSGNNYTFLTQHGLEFLPGDAADVMAHGYGASLFLRHFARSDGALVGNILKRGALRAPGLLANPKFSPVEAIAAELDIASAWRAFVRDYVSRKLTPSGYPGLNEIYGQLGGRCSLADGGSCPAIAWNAPDLSARFVPIDLNRNWRDNTTLTIEMDDAGGGAEAIVYKTTGNWDIVGSIRAGKLEIPNAETLAKDSLRLLLVLVNARAVAPYSATTGIAARIGTRTAIPPIRIAKSEFPSVTCKATRYNTTPPTVSGAICSNFSVSNWFNWTYLQGLVPMTWTGTSFSSKGNVTSGGNSCDVNIAGQLSEDAKTLVTARFQETCKYVQADKSWGEIEVDFTVNDLPFVGFDYNGWTMYFELKGEVARQHVVVNKYLETAKRADGTISSQIAITGPGTVPPVLYVGLGR